MQFQDIREFIEYLEKNGELIRITHEIDPKFEMTETGDRVLRAQGPALLFENPKGQKMPVLANLFGTPKRVALGMGKTDTAALREVGKLLAFLKEPEPPANFRDALKQFPLLKKVFAMRPKFVSQPLAQSIVIEKDAIDLANFPIQTSWPKDVAPLITWGLTITKGP